jgi:hypothetical protein
VMVFVCRLVLQIPTEAVQRVCSCAAPTLNFLLLPSSQFSPLEVTRTHCGSSSSGGGRR